MGTNEKFCLRWNDFENNISVAFREIREEKEFFDCTLSVGDRQLQAHKLILSACSPFFKSVLKNNPHQHPLLYLKGVAFTNLQAVLNFMYHGEVNVAQEELNSFLAVAEDLKIKGLTKNNSSTDEQSVFKDTDKGSDTESRPSSNFMVGFSNLPKTQKPKYIPQLQRQQPDDDDIQEVMPVVKTEPVADQKQQPTTVATFQQSLVQTTPDDGSESQVVGGTISQIEDRTGYGEDDGYDYGGYEEGYEGGETGEPSQGIDNSVEEGSSNQYIQSDQNGFQCTVCGKYFDQRFTCKRHIQFVHEKTSQKSCHLCSRAFKNVPSFKSHLRTVHSTYTPK